MRRIDPKDWHEGVVRIWIISVMLFSILPIAIMFMMSFSSSEFVRFPPPSFSLKWYAAYFSSTDWIEVTLRSIWIGFVVSLGAVLIGVPASIGVNHLGTRAANAAMAIVIMPIVLPPVVVAVAMYMYFAEIGLVGTQAGIIIGHLVLATPFVILTTLASLRRLDAELVKAALSLGATRKRVFFMVILPLIRPGIISGAFFAFLTSFDELMIALFIGNPETRTLPRRMWEGIHAEFDPTIAAASTLVVVVTVLLVACAWLGSAFARFRKTPTMESTIV